MFVMETMRVLLLRKRGLPSRSLRARTAPRTTAPRTTAQRTTALRTTAPRISTKKHQPRHHLWHDRSEGGASSVEFAIILPFLVGILVGMLEFSLLLKNVALTGSAVNGASRVASVESRKSQYQQHAFESVVALLQRNSLVADKIVIFKADKATGLPRNGAVLATDAPVPLLVPDDFSSCVSECFVWTKTATGYREKLDESDPLVTTKVVQWPWWKQSACGSADNTDFLGVWVELRHKYVTPMFGKERRLRKSAIYRLEPVAYANSDECDGTKPDTGSL
jgi:Flp pilus assembly protein TadG